MNKLANGLCVMIIGTCLVIPLSFAAQKKPQVHQQAHSKSPALSSKKIKSPQKAGTSPCVAKKESRNSKTKHRQQTCSTLAEPVLKSPINSNSLEKSVPSDRNDQEIKARTVPDRAYAVDGETFFYQGRKFRIAGLGAPDNSEMAKQRMQKLLDGGALAIEAQSTDDNGVTTATVRINGRNVSELMQGSEPR